MMLKGWQKNVDKGNKMVARKMVRDKIMNELKKNYRGYFITVEFEGNVFRSMSSSCGGVESISE